jgi:imidazolonepropionase-like amidohydrolase
LQTSDTSKVYLSDSNNQNQFSLHSIDKTARMNNSVSVRKSTALITMLLISFVAAYAQQTIKAIKAGKLIDTENGTVLSNMVILIEADTIKAIGKNISIPANAQVIDLSNATVLPGLIDCHTHITGEAGGNYYDIFRKTPIDYAIVAHIYAKRTLEAGFTSCRDLGSLAFTSVALRNAINEMKIPGPRLQVATFYIGATGSHGDMSGFSPFLKFDYPPEMTGVADGVEGVRKKVRYLVKNGADVIKFGAGAGVLSEEESVGAPQYTQEEMNAIVEEANMWGKRVCAHAHGTEAIKMAVKAKVNSIEHGSMLDEEAINLMLKYGTYLVADIYNDDYIVSTYEKLGYPEKIINKEKQVGLVQRQSFQKAVRAGVKIAFGTDAGVYPHGDNGKQFSYMVKWGMTPMQAIQSATIYAADLLGWKNKTGSIAVGKYADIIAITGNPVDNAALLEHVQFVMKGGDVIKNEIIGSKK